MSIGIVKSVALRLVCFGGLGIHASEIESTDALIIHVATIMTFDQTR